MDVYSVFSRISLPTVLPVLWANLFEKKVRLCNFLCFLYVHEPVHDHVLDLIGELPDDLILHLVHLPVHHLVTLVNHLAALVRHLANIMDQQTLRMEITYDKITVK